MKKTCNTPGKKAYKTRKEAYQACRGLAKNCRPYECRCGHYHITHR